jgi:membrane protein YdbS with pleckstrin-like domain
MKDLEMKPFTINRNSWHYKLNKNFFNDHEHWMQSAWEPSHNNFCSYWRATVFRMIFASFLVSLVLVIVGILSYLAYLEPLAALSAVGTVIAIFAVFIGIVFTAHLLEERKWKKLNEEPSQSLFAQKYRANKEKICPMVEYR